MLQLCESYPRHLCFPKAASDEVVRGSAKFRSKGRLPALSYYYKINDVRINHTMYCITVKPLILFNPTP